MSLIRKSTEWYQTPDGRFEVTAHYRPARRGPNSVVRDGWSLTDTLTGASRSAVTLSHAVAQINSRLYSEAIALGHGEDLYGWSFPFGQRSHSHLHTLKLYTRRSGSVRSGRHHTVELIAFPDNVERSLVQSALQHFGLAHLREYPPS